MSDSEPLMLTYDASPPDLSYGALVGFCAGKHAIELARVSPEVTSNKKHWKKEKGKKKIKKKKENIKK